MRPFRCPVTILNTKDHLGKFDGKADEGFFVGYFLNSKAFRVFNSRTRIVEENSHIRFSKNTPNVVGSGPDWLFDIDALTRTINYEPIVACTQYNNYPGTKACDNTSQARKETKLVKDYILLPLWTADLPFSQDPKSSHDDGFEPLNNDRKKVDEDPSKGNEYNELSFDLNMPALEDVGTFDFSNKDEDDNIVADMNNMDTTIQVSPVLNIRIHKDHPLDQKTKTTQALEITSLKRRVKKLKNKQRSRTHKLKRLYKVGLTARVDSFEDDQSLGEDASKQGRKIHYIDADEDITLVNDIDVDEDITLVNYQNDAEMFDVNDLHGEEVSVDGEVNATSIATTISGAATITTDKITLAQALMEIKTSKPKAKGIVLQEPKFEEEQRLAGESAQKEQEANIALIEEWNDIQAKIDADYKLVQSLQAEEQQELTDAEKATLFIQFLEKRRKFLTAKSTEEKRNKPSTQAQQRKIMCTYLKNVKEKKLKDLKNKSFDSIQKMFDRAFKRVNIFVDFYTELVKGSSKRAREELTQGSSNKQKLDVDKETVELKELMEIIQDKKEVAIDVIPLTVKSPKIVN
nr:ribonuclease H-like domain-containing protein [Tanacetum cinerariifolium]